MAARPPPPVVPSPARRATLPAVARLPILIGLNAFLSSTLWSAAESLLGSELGPVSKRPDQDDWVVPIARLLIKMTMVSVAWRLKYDSFDVGALAALANFPYAYLLTTFYNITPFTALAVVVNEVIAIALPTHLLRPLADVNNPSVSIRNRYLLNSTMVSLSNVALAVAVYTAVFHSALETNRLTDFLVGHFDIPTVQQAHDATVLALIGTFLLPGLATKAFLLNPSIGATPDTGAATPIEHFDPAKATLPQTLEHNFWFFSRRTRTLIQRTMVLALFLCANTVQRSWTLDGSEALGAVGYSGFWILASVICAAWYGWTGDAEA